MNTVNGGLAAGVIESGDFFTVMMSEDTIDLDHIIGGWTGGGIAVVAKVFNNADGGNDVVAVCSAADAGCSAAGSGSSNLLGRVRLNSSLYVLGDMTFAATMTWSAGTKTFTVRLNSCSSGCLLALTGLSTTASFDPKAGASAGGIRDLAGNPVDPTNPSETGLHF